MTSRTLPCITYGISLKALVVLSGALLAFCITPLPAAAETNGATPPAASENSGDDPSDLAAIIARVGDGSLDTAAIHALDGPMAGDVLSYFANRDDDTSIERLLKLGMAADQKNSFETNALIAAITSDSLKAAAALIAGGASRDATTARGTPADYAGAVGSIEMAMLLRDGHLPGPDDLLRAAARKGDTAEVKKLIEAGADPNSADSDGATPILEAASAGSVATVEALLALKARPDGSPDAATTPLAVAVVAGDVDMVKALTAGGADPDSKVRGVPILTLAVIAGQREVTDILLKNGAYRDVRGDDGTRPADIAAVTGQPDLARALGGSEALKPHVDFFAAIRSGNDAKVTAALKAGADPDQRNAEGFPALVYAAAYGNSAIVRALLAAKADPLATGPHGSSALHAAYARSDEMAAGSVALALLTHHSISNPEQVLRIRDDNGRSAAVVVAAHAKATDSSNSLLKMARRAAADEIAPLADDADKDGITPLAAAVLTDNGPLVAAFVAAGAKAGEIRSSDGAISLQELARTRGNWKALYFLPSDRVMPKGLVKGADIQTKQDFQALLKKWGYYKGDIDGKFGPRSRAAAVAFFKDRVKELKTVAAANRRESSYQFPKGKFGSLKTRIDFRTKGDSCKWMVVEWYLEKKSDSEKFVGCVQGGQAWNANGIGYVVYGDGSDSLELFGDGGWKEAQTLR